MTSYEQQTTNNKQQITIRDISIDDLAPIYHLGERLFTRDRYPSLYRTWDEWEVARLYNTDWEYCLVAEIERELAGFILGTIFTKHAVTYGYLNWMGVEPKFQRHGVGDRLVDKLIERMIGEDVQLVLADTDPENTPAINFFKGKGFDGERKHVFLSMNLIEHEYYGKLIAYERDKKAR
ncbi:MAG: GNAT family N-acetyltransferase [Cyanobacteria bacterium P01_E01_bin.42]